MSNPIISMFPLIWIHNIGIDESGFLSKAFDGSEVRWKIGPAYRHPEAKGFYVHHEDIVLAAQLMHPEGLEFQMISLAGTMDYLPMVHVISRPGEVTQEEMTFVALVEAKYAVERIDWTEADAYKKYLEEAAGPEDLDTNKALGDLLNE